jgi:hypothetical protein
MKLYLYFLLIILCPSIYGSEKSSDPNITLTLTSDKSKFEHVNDIELKIVFENKTSKRIHLGPFDPHRGYVGIGNGPSSYTEFFVYFIEDNEKKKEPNKIRIGVLSESQDLGPPEIIRLEPNGTHTEKLKLSEFMEFSPAESKPGKYTIELTHITPGIKKKNRTAIK